jgi:isoquinoline 1-oxidoreductase beta subunit
MSRSGRDGGSAEDGVWSVRDQTVSRRFVLRSGAVAGGLALGCFGAFGTTADGGIGELAGAAPELTGRGAAGPWAWIRIDRDGDIAAYSAFTEIGQGIHTLVATIVAEELEVEPADVTVLSAPVDPRYVNPFFGDQATGGSTSARAALPALQTAAAGVRTMLLTAAAERWHCPPADCVPVGGAVRNTGTGAVLGYGALAGSASRLPSPRDVAVKPPGAWRLLGRPQARVDSPAKIAGAALYGIDIDLPGMLLGTVINAPVAGGRLLRVDAASSRALGGDAVVVPLDDAVVVLAGSFWAAERAASVLRPDWDLGPSAGLDSTAISARLRVALDGSAVVAEVTGDDAATAARVERMLSLDYEVPPLAHAAIEPPNATVRVTEERVEIWAPTQAPEAARTAVAAALARPEADIDVETTLAGGSFGRNLDTRVIVQAALAARAAGRPVKLIWPRAQDLRHDTYRPPAACRIVVGLDRDGMPVRWEQRIAVPDLRVASRPFRHDERPPAVADPEAVEGAVGQPYDVPYRRIDWADADVGLPVGWWRSVGHSFNAWFVEHAIDEIAHAAGLDPIGLRRLLLRAAPRHRAVLDALTAMWPAPPAEGRFRGTAVHASFGSVVAQSAEISVTAGNLIVHHVNCAVDCGIALDPDAVAAQMQGGIVFGLTAALHGSVSVLRGQVQEANFDACRLLTLADSPTIDVRIVAPAAALQNVALHEALQGLGGVGEAGVPPIAPAVCNAVLAATGRAVRRLPIRLP